MSLMSLINSLEEKKNVRLTGLLSLLTPQASGPTSRHPDSRRIVTLLDEFKVVGVNGVRILFFLSLQGTKP